MSLLVREREHEWYASYGRPSRRHLTEYGGLRCMRCGVPERVDAWPPFQGLGPCRTLSPLGWLLVIGLALWGRAELRRNHANHRPN